MQHVQYYLIYSSIISLLQKNGSKIRNRVFLLVGFALFGLFGAQQIKVGGTGLVGAGALSVLVLAFMVHLRWKKDPSTELLKQALLMLWLFVEPFLFGLIGAAVDVYSIDPQIIGVCRCVYWCTCVMHGVCKWMHECANV